MVRGLALAETTPGPLIIVVQFVAVLGAYANPGTLSPWLAGVIASLLVSWVTFVPSFLFIFLGAPYIERLRHNTGLTAALTGITAAVVGVIANLGLFFAVHTLFTRTIAIDAGVCWRCSCGNHPRDSDERRGVRSDSDPGGPQRHREVATAHRDRVDHP
jgi:chromate transporter